MPHLPHRARILLAALLAVAGFANAQVFHVQAGDSTLLNAQGGSVEFKAPNYAGSVGAGFADGHFELGAETRYVYHGYTMLAGDENVPFFLPTDVFDASHYFTTRGAGVTRTDGRERIFAFAGATSTFYGTGFFSAASSDKPASVFFYERTLNPKLKFFSREIFSNRQTLLQGLEWKTLPWLTTAATGGVGSNEKYLATSVDAKLSTLAFKAAYVLTGDNFQRITVSAPLSSEANKGNVQLLYKPNQFVSVTTGHENIIEPLTLGGPMQQASVNQLSIDVNLFHFDFGSGLFSSTTQGQHTVGTNFYAGRRFGRRLEFNANWFESRPQTSPKTTVVSTTVRENFSDRFGLLQLVSESGGQTSFGFGGYYTSNRLIAQVNYLNVYLPFRPDNPFEQAISVNASVRIVGPLQATVASNVAPDGHIRYTFGVNTYLYRIRGMISALPGSSFSMGKYVVQGTVKDEAGNPIEGAALRIGKDISYTDSDGHFLARFSKRGPFPLTVEPQEFLSALPYEAVSAPSQVKADPDTAATPIEITVRVSKVAPRPPAAKPTVSSTPTGH